MRKIFLLIIIMTFTGCTNKEYSFKEAYQRLEEDETEIFHSDEFGDIQYKMINTNGSPVLIVHGIVGGYDQGLQTAKYLFPSNRQILSVSRFGYLKSDLPDNPTPLNQCKAYIELLDNLEIEDIYMMAASAGGTVALTFALNYPERLKGLILVGSGYPQPGEINGPTGPPALVYNDGIFQFMLNHMQNMMLDMFGVTTEEYESATTYEKEKLKELFSVILPIKPRRPGIMNDQNITNPYMVTHYDEYPMEEIQTPVLILHAKNDPMALYSSMTNAAKRFPNAMVISYETGGHILFGHEQENREAIEAFLSETSNKS